MPDFLDEPLPPAPTQEEEMYLDDEQLLKKLNQMIDTSNHVKRRVIESVKYKKSSSPIPLGLDLPVKPATVVNDSRVLSSQFRSQNYSDPSLRATYNKGPFTIEEKRLVNDAVKDYLEENEIPEEDLYYLIHRRTKTLVDANTGRPAMLNGQPIMNPYADKKYNGFISALRDKTSINRSCDQIYWFLSRACSIHRSEGKKWSKDEDEQLLHLVATKGRKWATIERIMGRTDTRARYSKLKRDMNGCQMGKWSEQEETALHNAMNTLSQTQDLKNFNSWSAVSELVKTRTATQCRSKWTTDLVHKANGKYKWRYENDKQLLMQILEKCPLAQDETEVIWDALVGESCTTGTFLCKRWVKLRSMIQDIENYTFIDSVNKVLSSLQALNEKPLSEEYIVDSDAE